MNLHRCITIVTHGLRTCGYHGFLQLGTSELTKCAWRSNVIEKPPLNAVILDEYTQSPSQLLNILKKGNGIIWRGDYHRGKQLLQEISRLVRKSHNVNTQIDSLPLKDRFLRQRYLHREQIVLLSNYLIHVEADYDTQLLPRAPDIKDACRAAFGPTVDAVLLPLREILGAVGAYEWFKTGIVIPGLPHRIHPHFGVFAPSGRKEYVNLLQSVQLPAPLEVGIDIGVGSGVLTAVLLHRGVQKVYATDTNPRAISCAADNFSRMGVCDRVTLSADSLFPVSLSSRGESSQVLADVVVCNPPWLPMQPGSTLDEAVYDPDSQMLRGFLAGLKGHLRPGTGVGMLFMSNLAELLGFRTRKELLNMIYNAGLEVRDKVDTTPSHRRVSDSTDPLHTARSQEIVSLWVLGPVGESSSTSSL